MPLNESVEQFYIKDLPGMNNQTETLDLKGQWVEKALNCRFEPKLGAIDKRSAVSYYNSTTTGSEAVTGLRRFYTSTGTTKWVMTTGTSCYVGTDATGTWTSIRDDLTTGKRMSYETYKDLLICSNGYDAIFCYDGSSDNVTWELGSCKAVLGASGGSLDASSTYSYKITFDDDAVVNGAVSNTVTTDGTYKRVSLTNIPLGPVGTTNRKIYRTEGNGSSYYLIDTISDNTTTTYTDNAADTTTTPYPAVTDSMPVGSILKVHRERLFISGDPTYPNKIYYSNVYLPHYIQQTSNLDYMEISPDDGDEISGIPIQLGTMLCIKKNTVRKLHITSPTSGADPTTWYADDPVAFTGSPAPWSITQTPYGVVFLGWGHWYLYDGAQLSQIIKEFDTSEILPATYSDTVGFYHNGIFLAAYADNTIASQHHNRIMRYNFLRKKLSIDFWTSSTLTGANCFAAKTGDDETGDLFFGDSQLGYVVKARDAEIAYRLRTKSECIAGTTSDTFVGGTENAPYIEIGAVQAASAIPDNICIFWDSLENSPGSGWVELTNIDDKFLLISTAAVGTTAGDVGVSSTTLSTYTISKYRMFYSSGVTDTEFPDGSIVIWDQSTPPTGWSALGETNFLQVNDTDLTDSTFAYGEDSETGAGGNIDNKLEVMLIKKVGEADSWDGVDKYVYALWYSDGATSNGWDDVTSEYDGYFLKGKASGAPSKTLGGDTTYASNYALMGAHNETWSASGGTDPTTYTSSFTGDFANAYDGSNATFRELYLKHTGDGFIDGNLTHTHTWTTPRHVDTVNWKTGLSSAGGNYKENDFTTYIYIQTNGSWTLIDSDTFNTPGAGSCEWYSETWTDSSSTGWDNVTGLRVVMDGYAYSYEEDDWYRAQEIKLRVYNISVGGYMDSVSFRIAKKILGKMKDYNAANETQYTSGTWTSPSQQINAEELGKLFWNEDIDDTVNDNITFQTRTGATKTACEAASWDTAVSDPNGSDFVSSANVWIQYRINFTAADTRTTNPKVYFTNAYVVKYTYSVGAVSAESSVNFLYEVGFRNFDKPFLDKFFKLIGTVHEGSFGSFL